MLGKHGLPSHRVTDLKNDPLLEKMPVPEISWAVEENVGTISNHAFLLESSLIKIGFHKTSSSVFNICLDDETTEQWVLACLTELCDLRGWKLHIA